MRSAGRGLRHPQTDCEIDREWIDIGRVGERGRVKSAGPEGSVIMMPYRILLVGAAGISDFRGPEVDTSEEPKAPSYGVKQLMCEPQASRPSKIRVYINLAGSQASRRHTANNQIAILLHANEPQVRSLSAAKAPAWLCLALGPSPGCPRAKNLPPVFPTGRRSSSAAPRCRPSSRRAGRRARRSWTASAAARVMAAV